MRGRHGRDGRRGGARGRRGHGRATCEPADEEPTSRTRPTGGRRRRPTRPTGRRAAADEATRRMAAAAVDGFVAPEYPDWSMVKSVDRPCNNGSYVRWNTPALTAPRPFTRLATARSFFLPFSRARVDRYAGRRTAPPPFTHATRAMRPHRRAGFGIRHDAIDASEKSDAALGLLFARDSFSFGCFF